MAAAPNKFAQLLTEGVHRIRIREAKSIQIIQDELGYALGREGGSAIEYWRKGHVPPHLHEIETLAREIVQRGQLEQQWLQAFLQSTDFPEPERLHQELFTNQVSTSTPTHCSRDGRSRKIELPDIHTLAPFVIGPPVTHPVQFFGRESELKRIFNVWKRYPLQNVAIIGAKRSGKSSLLHYLRTITNVDHVSLRSDQRSDWLPQPDQYQWVYVDFQDIRMCRQERLTRHILTHLDMPAPEPCGLDQFLDVIIEHLRNPTIILMDEIGAALAAPELDMPFWWSLRSLGTNLTQGKLAFALAAHESPAQLAEEQGKPSPFFNIFGHVLKTGPLNEKAARELIVSSPVPFSQQDTEWILLQSKCWPALLQLLCHTRLMSLEEAQEGDMWKEEALARLEPYHYLLSG